jgi:hypothetical protein
MMTLRQAMGIHSGDIVYDISGRELTVKDYSITFSHGEPKDAYFTCIDNSDSKKWQFTYKYDELYQNFEDLSDDEQSFISWVRTVYPDLKYRFDDDLNEIRTAYSAGFFAGLTNQLKTRAEEQLQK